MWESCGGCQYEEFPYTAKPPILIDGKYKNKKFNNLNDIWDVIDLLVKEVKQFNKESNKSFDIAKSIRKQIPQFACINCLYDKDIQKAVQRYLYCQEFNVPPYEGSYGQQPAFWVEMSSIIKNVLAKKERDSIEDAKRG